MFFSIILPTYNRGHLLSRSIQSVLDQSYVSWELIIIDDGSTDSTKKVVTSFNHPNIRYIFQTNQERSTAKNNGIQYANGEFVCFLDSDDYFLNNHLEVLSKHCKQVDFVSTLAFNRIGNELIKNNRFSLNNDKITTIWLQDSFPCCSIAIRKSLLEKEKFDPNLFIWEDYHLYFRILFNCKIALVNEYTSVVVWGEESSSYMDYHKFNINSLSNFSMCVKNIQKENLQLVSHLGNKTFSKKVFFIFFNFFNVAYKSSNKKGMKISINHMRNFIIDFNTFIITLKSFIKSYLKSD